MFPDVEVLGLSLYELLILIGVIVAFAFLRLFSEKLKISAKIFNFTILTAVLTVVVGYGFAVLFQMLYNYLATGDVSQGGGSTFYGGLIGGAVFFLGFYIGVGLLIFKKKENIVNLPIVVNSAITCVVIAHAFGRIGCLMAGCCYGVHTDSWIGIEMGTHGKVVPTQLFEAIFLFIFFAYLTWMLLKKRNEYIMSQYLIGYGVWRFIIEYWRGDEARGATFVDGVSPSQYTAIYMVLIGIVLIFVYKRWLKDAFLRLEAKQAALSEVAQGATVDNAVEESTAQQEKDEDGK